MAKKTKSTGVETNIMIVCRKLLSVKLLSVWHRKTALKPVRQNKSCARVQGLKLFTVKFHYNEVGREVSHAALPYVDVVILYRFQLSGICRVNVALYSYVERFSGV